MYLSNTGVFFLSPLSFSISYFPPSFPLSLKINEKKISSDKDLKKKPTYFWLLNSQIVVLSQLKYISNNCFKILTHFLNKSIWYLPPALTSLFHIYKNGLSCEIQSFKPWPFTQTSKNIVYGQNLFQRDFGPLVDSLQSPVEHSLVRISSLPQHIPYGRHSPALQQTSEDNKHTIARQGGKWRER